MIDLIVYPIVYLFIAFAFTIRVKHKVKGTKWEMPTKYLLVYPFVIFDFFVNLIPMSILMLELPPQIELVTGRMKRYKLIYYPMLASEITLIQRWRLFFAISLCQLINTQDKDHC